MFIQIVDEVWNAAAHGAAIPAECGRRQLRSPEPGMVGRLSATHDQPVPLRHHPQPAAEPGGTAPGRRERQGRAALAAADDRAQLPGQRLGRQPGRQHQLLGEVISRMAGLDVLPAEYLAASLDLVDRTCRSSRTTGTGLATSGPVPATRCEPGSRCTSRSRPTPSTGHRNRARSPVSRAARHALRSSRRGETAPDWLKPCRLTGHVNVLVKLFSDAIAAIYDLRGTFTLPAEVVVYAPRRRDPTPAEYRLNARRHRTRHLEVEPGRHRRIASTSSTPAS